MPRPGPRMQQLAVRLDEATIAKVDELVDLWQGVELGHGSVRQIGRSDVLRAAIIAYLR